MKNRLQDFAEQFATRQEQKTREVAEQRSVSHPVVFLFVGDLVTKSLDAVYQNNEKKWQNSAGVMYFHAYQTTTIENQNVVSLSLPTSTSDKKEQRKELFDQFYLQEDRIIELNKAFRKLSMKISEYGKMYSSLQRVNLSVVTRVDDPANILVPELTLLLKSILSDSFKSVEVDLYGLIQERNESAGFGYSAALGISFLKELDRYQQADYSFHKDIHITEDYLKLPVDHEQAPLFELAYLLSDKNEKGLLSLESVEQNDAMISLINLLKNQQKQVSDGLEQYNNAQFHKNIEADATVPVYASAGLANVERPNHTIALHTAYHFMQHYLQSLKKCASQPKEKVLDLFGMMPLAFENQIAELIPAKENLADMTKLMWNVCTYQEIKKQSVLHAEDRLFEGAANDFFKSNFEKLVKEFDVGKFTNGLVEQIITNQEYGIYCAYQWTSDDDSIQSVRNEIRKMKLKYKKMLAETENELEQAYQQMVDTCDFKKSYLPFSDKKNLRSFLSYLIETIYSHKYDCFTYQSMMTFLKKYEIELEHCHEIFAEKINQLEEVASRLSEAAKISLHDTDAYLGKNVNTYYQEVIAKIMTRFHDKWGTGFFANERFFGNVLPLLESGTDAFLERLLTVTQQEIFNQVEFNQSFEDELFERSNVKTDYENRDVVSRDELYKQLFTRLNEHAAVQIDVYHYTQKHRYEEKYLFGDYESPFMKYAVDREYEARHCKVGCVHEKKASGIEKLNLMGGFQLTDLMYYRNHLKYYTAYLENDYRFHVDGWEEEDAFTKI